MSSQGAALNKMYAHSINGFSLFLKGLAQAKINKKIGDFILAS